MQNKKIYKNINYGELQHSSNYVLKHSQILNK